MQENRGIAGEIMAYLKYEQVAVTATVKTVSDLSIPPKATHVELQAVSQNVNYLMDLDSGVPTQTRGMVLATTHEPKTFLIEDLQRIKFVRGAGSDGLLSLHYFAGRRGI